MAIFKIYIIHFLLEKKKDFIELLNLIGEVGIESVERSIEVN